jgi:hypothetical protein
MINGTLAVKGMEVTDFRGEKAILTGWREPHKPSSSGFVQVRLIGGRELDTMEYYAEVFGGKFIYDEANPAPWYVKP